VHLQDLKSYSGVAEDSGLLRCEAVLLGGVVLIFWRTQSLDLKVKWSIFRM